MHPIDTDPTLRALLIEYQRVRDHNLKALDRPGEPAFPIAEGALALTLAERFLRVVLGSEAEDRDTLPTLLDKATSARLNIMDPPLGFAYLPYEDGATPARTHEQNREFSKAQITRIRNPLTHGNYEQAARDCGAGSVDAYFADGHHRRDLEIIFEFIGGIWLQYDRNDRLGPTDRWRSIEEESVAAELIRRRS